MFRKSKTSERDAATKSDTNARSETTKAGDQRFTGAPINRRDFIRLSAITAGALTLPGQTLANISAPELTDLYEFVVNHTPEEYRVGTLLLVEDRDVLDELAALELQEFREATDPEPAAYAQLDNNDVQTVIDIDGILELQFSPGANPFWRLGRYQPRVFPEALDSVDHFDFEETITGLQVLEANHPNRLEVSSIGHSPGWYNHELGEIDQKDIWVAEITNEINDEEAFAAKDKVVFILSIHGPERAGVEAGNRFIENLLEGEESETEALLDELVLVFVYANPDGWIARYPQYAHEDEDPLDRLTYKRGNSRVQDTNRQYPTAGWINPARFPAEPNGMNLEDDQPGEFDDDLRDEYPENVPDALAIVERFREYENLEYCADLHGMGWDEHYALGLHLNSEYDHQELHDIYDVNRKAKLRITEQLEDHLSELEDEFRRHAEEEFENPDVEPPTDIVFDYGTLYETLGYETSGDLISWMTLLEEQGGVDAKTVAYELASVRPRYPELVNPQVIAYSEVIRTLAEHATQQIDASITTNERSTAYVTTDALTRSSDDLVFAASKADHTGTTVRVGPDPTRVTTAVEETTQTITFTIVQRSDAHVVAELRDPNGEVRATFDSREDEADAEMCVVHPEAGEWTVELVNPRAEPPRESDVAVLIDTVVTEPTNAGVHAPDPREILGYEQRSYDVTPFSYFDSYAEFTDEESLHAVTVSDVRRGALLDDGQPKYDNIIVIHDEGAANPTYIDALDEFVDAGGNVLLTDRGVSLLAQMNNEYVSDITEDDISEETVFSVGLIGHHVHEDHVLLQGSRPIQRGLYTPVPLGYPISVDGQAPATVIDADAFNAAGGDPAGRLTIEPAPETVSDWVVAGSFHDDGTGVHVVGGLFPPVTQEHLHPFGVFNQSITYLGHTMLTNALGHDQHRFVDGEEITLGETILSEEQQTVYHPPEDPDEEEPE